MFLSSIFEYAELAKIVHASEDECFLRAFVYSICSRLHTDEFFNGNTVNIVEWWRSAPRGASVPRSQGGSRGGGRELRMEVPDVTDRFEAEVPDVT